MAYFHFLYEFFPSSVSFDEHLKWHIYRVHKLLVYNGDIDT